jgi:hypothetical protein
MMRVLPVAQALKMGYSADKRKRRREHRRAARMLIASGTIFNARAPRGSIPHSVAAWHLFQARWDGR